MRQKWHQSRVRGPGSGRASWVVPRPGTTETIDEDTQTPVCGAVVLILILATRMRFLAPRRAKRLNNRLTVGGAGYLFTRERMAHVRGLFRLR